MSGADARRIAFVVHGRVQGVAFRSYARDAARDLELTGWVRNRVDGAVEGEAQGEPSGVAKFVAFLEQGSPWSRVTRVEVADLSARTDDSGFVVQR